MSGHRLLAGLVFWFGVLVALATAGAQPTTAEKAKQRAESGDKADALIREGKFAGAIEPATACVRLSREIDGPKHWRTFDAEQRLKLAETAKPLGAEKQKKLLEAMTTEEQAKKAEASKPAEALELAQVALDGYRELLGKESVEVARTGHLIGRIWLDNNDPEEAQESTEPALNIRRKILPDGHPDLGHSFYQLGLIRSRLNDKKAAGANYKEAARLWKVGLGENHLLIATALNNLGSVQRSLREFEEAKKTHTEALAVYRKVLPKDHPDIARSLNNLAFVQRDLQEHKGAKDSFVEALSIVRKVLPKDHPALGELLHFLGTEQRELREHEAAKESFSESLAIFRKALPKGHPAFAQSLSSLGLVQRELRELKAAKESYTEALAVAREAFPKDHPGRSQILSSLGFVQYDLQEYKAAKESFTEALTLRRDAFPKDHPDIATSLNNLGELDRILGEREAARRSYIEALTIQRKVLPKDHPDIAGSLLGLGLVRHELREYEAAKQNSTEALAILRKAVPKNQPAIAQCLHNLGNLEFSLRDFDAAKKSYSEALAIRRMALPKDHPDLAMSLTNLGNTQLMLGDPAAALQSGTEALAALRKALPEDHPDIARNLNNVATIQQSLMDYEAAKKSHTEALAIFRKALPEGHPTTAASLNNLGCMQRMLGEYEAAKKSHTEALAIFRKALPKDHPDIVGCLFEIGILELCTRGTSAETLRLLAEALVTQRGDSSRLAGSQAEAEQLVLAREAQLTLNLYLSAVSDPGLDVSVSYNSVAAFKGAATAHQRWTRELRNPKDAKTAALLGQLAIIDQELLGSAIRGPSTERPRSSEDLRRRWEMLQEQRKDLEQQLSAHSETYRVFRAKVKIGGTEVRKALPPGTCLIDFREYTHIAPAPKGGNAPVIERRLVAFVIPPGTGRAVLVPLGKSEPITKHIEGWRASYGIGKLPAAGDPDPAAELRKALWEPLQKHIGKEVQTVLISPDGPLNGVPFAALPGAKAGTYLLHEYAFTVVPVPLLLPEMMENKPDQPEAALLLMGGIDFGDAKNPPASVGPSKLPPVPRFTGLPGTDSEVNDLLVQFEKAFPNASAPKILKKDQATKSAFLQNAPKYPYIHLATHGFFASESEKSALDTGPSQLGARDFRMDRVLVGRNPALLSGIVFADVNNPDRPKEDGVLTALEAGELDLSKTELVVLSACETGRGKVAGGEGVLGLQRAFQTAGARTTVASLWKVPDAATSKLMAEFYRRLWDTKKPMTRAEALRQAQLWFLKEVQTKPGLMRSSLVPEDSTDWKPGDPVPPFFWAAFVLSGDWR